ncbi:MAG: dTDP-4-dehydrorhamnose 3,5-epimerase family protein [Candidatus Omnitrophota bacterium]
MIEGVKIKKLKLIPDDRGRLMEILRRDDDIFEKFGQVYMTTAYPGVIKAWHYHKKQTDNFTCVKGKMRLGLYDAREDSPTFGKVEEYVIDLENPLLVKIPSNVYHGFKCIGDEEALVINTVTEPYDHDNPDEYRADPFDNDIPFDWSK